MSDTQIPLRPEGYYHIYNHAVGRENLFKTAKDYRYFLSQYRKHIFPVSDLLAYCLMPNHFHLVIRFKNNDQIKSALSNEERSKVSKLMMTNEDISYQMLSQLFSNCFNAYAKYYNFWKKRTGTLFKRAFRRKEISNMDYLRQLICYVHKNPVEAGFTAQLSDWEYSSYSEIIGSQPTFLPRADIISFFGDLENFIYCHSKQAEHETEFHLTQQESHLWRDDLSGEISNFAP